jgi:hypothetical protein
MRDREEPRNGSSPTLPRSGAGCGWSVAQFGIVVMLDATSGPEYTNPPERP